MQRQLAELDSARERFIATASHELRTPIFSLGGFLELIQDEELDEETRRQFVGQVRTQVERLGNWRPGCSTFHGWRRGRWSCARNASTWQRSRRWSRRSSSRR